MAPTTITLPESPYCESSRSAGRIHRAPLCLREDRTLELDQTGIPEERSPQAGLRQLREGALGPQTDRIAGTRCHHEGAAVPRGIEHGAGVGWNRQTLLRVDRVLVLAEEEHASDLHRIRVAFDERGARQLDGWRIPHPAPPFNTFPHF